MSKFCITCGANLIATPRIWGYDEMTGKAKTTYDYTCVNQQRLWVWKRERHPCTTTEAFTYFGM